MRATILAALLTIGAGTAAHAQQVIAGGPLFAGPTQTTVVCYFYNSGTTNIGISGTRLATSFGNVPSFTVNECATGTVPPGRGCGIAANAVNNLPYTCKATISPNKGTTRGVLELRNSSQVSLTNVDLR